MAKHHSPENQLDCLPPGQGRVVGQVPTPTLASGIVVSSRISLSRNIASFPFLGACSVDQRNQIRQIIVEHARFIDPNRFPEIIDCQHLKYLEHQFETDLQAAIGLKLDQISAGDIPESRTTDGAAEQSLNEAKPADAQPETTALALGIPCAAYAAPNAVQADFRTCLFVNHEDHLQIQIEAEGDRLPEAWQIANQIDDAYNGHLSFAFHSQLGFLTACPSQVGTGMRASVLLHLPTSVATGNLPVLLKQLAQSNVALREVFADSGGGDFFRISNLATLGYREIDLLEQVAAAARQAILIEEESRQFELARDAAALEHEVRESIRDLEALDLNEENALQSSLAIHALSGIRLGLQLGLVANAEIALLVGRIAILQLQSKLKLAIADENYRAASRLRDRINVLSGAIG